MTKVKMEVEVKVEAKVKISPKPKPFMNLTFDLSSIYGAFHKNNTLSAGENLKEIGPVSLAVS